MPPPTNAVSPAPESPPANPVPPERASVLPWLRRIDLFVRIMIRLYIGLILVFLPWTHLWIYNRFFVYYTPIAHLAASGAVRGLVSGLGLLNLWIAIAEAIRYKEN